MPIDRAMLVKLASLGGVAAVAATAHNLHMAEATGLFGTGLALLGSGAHAWFGHLGLDFVHDLAKRLGAKGAARGRENRDLHRLIGDTISHILEQSAERAHAESFVAQYLNEAAKAFRGERWMDVELTGPETVIGEEAIPNYFSGDADVIKSTQVLEVSEWVALVGKVYGSTQIRERGEALDFAAAQLREHFAFELWESAKHAWKKDDLAWPALILRLLTELLGHASEAAKNSVELRGEIAALRDAVVKQAEPAITAAQPSDVVLIEAIRQYQDTLTSQLNRIEGKIDTGFKTVLERFSDLEAALGSPRVAPISQHQSAALEESADSPVLRPEAAPPSTLRGMLTIIIPVFNEGGKDNPTLEDLIQGLRGKRLTDRCEILICDDASTDNSFVLLQDFCKDISSITCFRNPINSSKVGAIEKMARKVRTPFVLTLDADCMIKELCDDALVLLLHHMNNQGYAAACFRIIPHDRNLLGRLQKLDYAIFTDTLRKILGVPGCLIGQGVVWRTESFLEVLSAHSNQFHGDDLENTVIALSRGMRLYWERETVVLTTIPKPDIRGLLRQRASSWDFGMFRVLLGKNALMLGGDSGAFYKNLLLMDLLAHPLRLLAIPLLLGVAWFRVTDVLGIQAAEVYRRSLAFSFHYGSTAIVGIWIASIVNSLVCVRGRLRVTLKFAIFNSVYLSSPFVFLMYYPLVATTNLNAENVFGAAEHWLLLGLLLTYVWWAILTFFLLWGSSLRRHEKMGLLWSVFWAPMYYFVLLVWCKSVGICKAVKARVAGY